MTHAPPPPSSGRNARGRAETLKRLACGLLLLLLLPPGADAKGPKFKPGAVVLLRTKSGVEYAVYVPERWKPKTELPLVIWIPLARARPEDARVGPLLQELLELRGGPKGGAFFCPVLLQSHNKVNAAQQTQRDAKRFLALLEKDTQSVAEVIEEVCAALPVQRGAVGICGQRYASGVAMGIAARLPERFAAIMLNGVWTVRLTYGDTPSWTVLPRGDTLERALGIPIVLHYAPDITNLDKREQEHAAVRDALRTIGFRDVELVLVDRERNYPRNIVPEAYTSFARLLAQGAARERRVGERDDLLVEAQRRLERKDLAKAVKAVLAAQHLEAEHGLLVASADVHAAVQAAGRQRLEEADGLSSSKRKAVYRKVARWFAGTPLGDEAQAALAGMK